MSMNLEQDKNVSGQIQEWWIVNQSERGLLNFPKQFNDGLEVYIFSDKVSPPSLGFLAGYGYVRMFHQFFLLYFIFYHCLRDDQSCGVVYPLNIFAAQDHGPVRLCGTRHWQVRA